MLYKQSQNLQLDTQIFTENVISQLVGWREEGIPSALVTLVGIEGSAPRRLGSQMAVNADGEYIGVISSGCAEGAIVAEAIDAVQSGLNRCVRYGLGSKYIDIVLPCGSGLDIYFDQGIGTDILKQLESAILDRESTGLTFELSEQSVIAIHPLASETNATYKMASSGSQFTRAYVPPPRIVVAGRGATVEYVAHFASQLEWDVIVASPDQVTLTNTSSYSSAHQHLNMPKDFDASVIDSSTAVVLLFHDHEWEPEILNECATSPAFYIGALGSRRTHEQRKLLLSELNCDANFIDRIHGPVGLSLGANNPPEIAIAIIGGILSTFAELDAAKEL